MALASDIGFDEQMEVAGGLAYPRSAILPLLIHQYSFPSMGGLSANGVNY